MKSHCSRSLPIKSIALILAASQAPSPLLAQTEIAQADEILVTGRIQAYRGNVPLEQLPQATQVISGATLQQLNITRLDAALDLSASISRQNGFGGMFDSFAIRGFVGDPNSPTGVLVNGFNGARGYAGPRDASNVEAIEVLRGPTSALFGRGEPGGTVNIVTKKPFFRAGGQVQASIGRFDTYRGELDYNLPLNDKVAVRVTGAYEQGDSFRDTLHSKKFTMSPSVLLKLDDFSANYELEFTKQKTPFDRGVVAINGDPGALPRSRFLGEPGDGNISSTVVGHQLQAEQKLFADWKLIGGIAYRYTSFDGFGEDPEFAAARNPFFLDGRTLSRRRIFRDYTGKDLIPRAEVSGSLMTGSIKHNILFGGDYEWFKLDILQTRYRPPVLSAAQRAEVASGNISAATLRTLNAIDIFNPVYTDVTALPMSAFQSRTEVAKAWGTYLRDRIELTDWLSIQAGIRYDDYRQTVVNRLARAANPTGYVPTFQKFNQWSPSVGLSVKASEELTFYGSFSKGFRANTGVNVRNEAFRPESSKSYEVGAKFDILDNRLSGTLALYKMEKSNVLTADPVNAGFTLDVGRAKSKGVEFDLNAKLPGEITGVLSYAYTDAYIADDILDPDFGRTIFAGDPLINIPKHSVSALLSKEFMIGERALNVGGSVKYVSSRLGETATTYRLPGYTTVRLFGALDVTEAIRVSADVNNLFNVHYYPSSYAALWTVPGAPREWTIRAAYKF